MIFCHCAVVGERQVADAVRAGARTTSQVCKATGAGQECGSCVFAVRRVLCEHVARTHGDAETTSASTTEVDVAAS